MQIIRGLASFLAGYEINATSTALAPYRSDTYVAFNVPNLHIPNYPQCNASAQSTHQTNDNTFTTSIINAFAVMALSAAYISSETAKFNKKIADSKFAIFNDY